MEITVTFKLDPAEIMQAISDKELISLSQKIESLSAKLLTVSEIPRKTNAVPATPEEITKLFSGKIKKPGKEKAPVGKISKPKKEKKPATSKPGKKLNGAICIKCGKSYQPTSNAQKFCSPECGLKPKWQKKEKAPKDPVKVDPPAVRTETPKKAAAPKQIPGFSIHKAPKSDPPAVTTNPHPEKTPRVLKAGERICANPHCRKTFKFEKLDQKYCSTDCDPDPKPAKKVLISEDVE